MIDVIHSVYSRLHGSVAKTIGAKGNDEDDRLDYLRELRNTHHGLLLRHFDKRLLKTSGAMPSELMYIPMVLSWAFILAPERVLAYHE